MAYSEQTASQETETRRRVAIVANSSDYVGPALARELAQRGCDLVLGDPSPELATEVSDLGAESWAVDGVRDLSDPTSAVRLLDMAMDAYGRVDAAVFFTGAIVTGPFMESTSEDIETVMAGNIGAPYRALRVFLPPMVAAGAGQVLAITSASGLRVTPGAPAVFSNESRSQSPGSQRCSRGRSKWGSGQRGRNQLHEFSWVYRRHRC